MLTLFVQKRSKFTEKIDFKTFMKGNVPEHKTKRKYPIQSTSFSISPLLFIDPVFLSIGLGIVALALAEKALVTKDHLPAAALLASILELSFPLIGFGAAIYFISKLMLI